MGTIGDIGMLLERRRFLLLVGAAAGAAILNACGGTSAPTSTVGPTAAAPTTVAPTTGAASAAAATRPASAASASPAVAASAAVTAAASPAAAGSATAPRTASSATAGTVTTSGSAAAGTANAATIPTLMIEAFDFGYRTVGSVPAGVTMVQMKNTGKETHQGSLLKLNDGVSFDQLVAAVTGNQNAIFGLTTFIGGPGEVDAGGTSTAILDLKPGLHVIVCFIPSPNDMVPHLAKGMILPLMVTAAPANSTVKLPTTLGTIMLKDFAFEVPAGQVLAGKSLYTATNVGKQPHEVNILRLADGKQAADVTNFFAGTPMGPPPFTSVGGITAMNPGVSGIFALDLTPGNYVMTCNVPDPMSGKAHLLLGMIAGFTVK